MRSPIKAITALITLAVLAVPTLAGAQDEPTRVLITNVLQQEDADFEATFVFRSMRFLFGFEIGIP